MNTAPLIPLAGRAHMRASPLGVLFAIIALLGAACTTPGAVAPSTMPMIGKYVELGPAEESTSCGYIALFIPLGAPKPVSALIEELVKSRGGDALIEVTSSSSSSYFFVGSNCVQIRGKVVKFTK